MMKAFTLVELSKTVRQGFTLIELLVVVTIIVVLLALLTPALDKAVREAEKVVCLTHQKQIGQALYLYTSDYKGVFPLITDWNTLLGKNAGQYGGSGNDVTTDGGSGNGVTTGESPRPLNIYLGYTSPKGEVPVAKCPSDIGDPLNGYSNCYDAYGTSYLVPFGPNINGMFLAPSLFRVRNVFGYAPSPSQGPSMRRTAMNPPHNKVIIGDWVWHANRLWQNELTRWHGWTGDPTLPTARRQLNFLFGDMHVEFFDKIEAGEIEVPPNSGFEPVDPSWKWW